MTVNELARPQLLAPGTAMYKRVIESGDWIAQEKVDGWRAYWDGKKMWTRHGSLFAAHKVPDWMPEGVELDGEFKDGKYIVFDCLSAGGMDLRERPLCYRLTTGRHIVGAEHMVDSALEYKRDAYKRWLGGGGEGMVLKNLKAVYPGADNHVCWYKVKP